MFPPGAQALELQAHTDLAGLTLIRYRLVGMF